MDVRHVGKSLVSATFFVSYRASCLMCPRLTVFPTELRGD